MNQIAVAYGIAGLAVAVAVATIIGTTVGLGEERSASMAAPPEPPAVAERLAMAAPAAGPVVYVDEQGNPVAAPTRGRRGEAHEGEEHEEHEGEEHEDEDEEHEDEDEEHEERGRRGHEGRGHDRD